MTPVSRLLSIAALVGLVVLAALVTLLILAYAFEADVPDDLTLDQLQTEAGITWRDDFPVIDADDEIGLFTALGTVHGVRRAWPATLLRQAATGGLARWYGTSMAEIDSLALQLGLASGAREAYRSLSSDEQRLLQAYAQGMNAALSRRSVRLQDEFSILGIEPERWEPWHSLAVERLFAWVASVAPHDTLLPPDQPGLHLIHDRTSHLRDLLAIGNLEHSAAWTSPIDGQNRLHVRLVYGSASKPMVDEQVIVMGGDSIAIASVPGSPVILAGSGSTHAWAILPTSSWNVTSVDADTLPLPLVYDRITDRDGTEYLVSFRRSAEGLELGRGIERTLGDTIGVFFERPVSHRMTWGGFAQRSDLSAWRSLLRGQAPSFTLFDGAGILQSGGASSLLVDAADRYASVGGVTAVGHSEWITSIAESVAAWTPDEDGPASVMDDTYSMWAATLAPDMISAARSIPEPSRPVRDALTYLRNWDFRYDDASIAATIFDVWVGRYRDSTGVDPSVTAADTFFTERHLRYRTLLETTEYLIDAYGLSMSQWRWANVMEDVRYTTGWPPRDRLADAPDNRRFATIELPGQGHPSAPLFAPSPLDGMSYGNATWEAVMSPGDGMDVRRRVIDMRSFIGRYMVPERPPDFVSSSTVVGGRRTLLRPVHAQASPTTTLPEETESEPLEDE